MVSWWYSFPSDKHWLCLYQTDNDFDNFTVTLDDKADRHADLPNLYAPDHDHTALNKAFITGNSSLKGSCHGLSSET